MAIPYIYHHKFQAQCKPAFSYHGTGFLFPSRLKNKKQILKKVKKLNLLGKEYTEIELSDVDDETS